MRTIDRSEQTLTGWGRASWARSTVLDVDSDQVADALAEVGDRGVIARGLGRSYGDAALNSGGEVLRLRSTPLRPDRPIVSLDPQEGTLTAGGGVSLADIIEYAVPLGLFIPVTPGTRMVSVGGAIASDIHGKNHHLDGSFGDHVRSIRLALADGTETTVTKDDNPGLFWATVGGMGLTGIVIEATFDVLPIETSRIVVDSRRFDNLESLADAMIESDQNYRYSVAWIDVMARGANRGRGVLTDGYHAARSDLPAGQRRDPLRYEGAQRVSFPKLVPPNGFINRATVAGFNEAWFRRVPSATKRTVETIPTYFHPLDGVGGWNLVYGQSGFLQYQFVVPLDRFDVIETIIASMSDARLPSFLTVLKRFGVGNQGHLSFPTQGWTLAVDVSTSVPGLDRLLREFDELVIASGGRHYLAKDHVLSPEQIRASYHRLADWQQIQARYDPQGVWASDQSRRLQLTDNTR